MNAKHILFKMTENKMNLANNKILSVKKKKKGGALIFYLNIKKLDLILLLL